MKENPESKGRITEGGKPIGTVTPGMVERRAREIALINGHERVVDSDRAQSKRELLGEEEFVAKPDLAEQLPENAHWPFPAGSRGHKVDRMPLSDETSPSEKAVEEGVGEAEHDQEVQAARDSLRRDTE